MDIVTFANQCEKTYAKSVEDAYMTAFVFLYDFSVETAKSVSNNDVVTQALENVKRGVFSGDTLTKLFAKEPVFPPTFNALVSVGEQTGNLDEMFTSVSAYYEEEFDTAVDNMSSLIEPIMIVFMGSMIGGLMIAMYSPIFNVGAIIGG